MYKCNGGGGWVGGGGGKDTMWQHYIKCVYNLGFIDMLCMSMFCGKVCVLCANA